MQHKECPLTPYAYAVNAVQCLYFPEVLYILQGIRINDIVDGFPDRIVDFARQLIKRFGKSFEKSTLIGMLLIYACA